MKLHNRTAIVTGGGQGIGRAICHAFASEGARVAVIDLNLDTAQKVASELTATGADALAIQGDVSKLSDIDDIVRRTLDRFEGVDILVNNAGLGLFRSVEVCTEEEWDRTLNINLKGPFLLAQAVIPHMKARQAGAIVNMVSLAGKIGGIVAGAPYSVSKAGLECLTKCLAREFAPFGIRANAIAPGIIDTPMAANHPQSFVDTIPLREKGRPEDVAACAVFLASDDARHITGETIDVNGGLLMD